MYTHTEMLAAPLNWPLHNDKRCLLKQVHCYSDLHVLDTHTSAWSSPPTDGPTPSARAGANQQHMQCTVHAPMLVLQHAILAVQGLMRPGCSVLGQLTESATMWQGMRVRCWATHGTSLAAATTQLVVQTSWHWTWPRSRPTQQQMSARRPTARGTLIRRSCPRSPGHMW